MQEAPWYTQKIALYPTIKAKQPEAHPTLEEWLNAVKNGRYSAEIADVRELKDTWNTAIRETPDDKTACTAAKERYETHKDQLPCVLLCGDSLGRHTIEALMRHNGLVHGDIDAIDDDNTLTAYQLKYQNHPATAYSFRSPSGQGLKVGLRVPPIRTENPYERNEHYKRLWLWVASVMEQMTGYAWDTQAKDIARLCYVSHDPDAYWNPHASVLEVPPLHELPEDTGTSNGQKRRRVKGHITDANRIWYSLVTAAVPIPEGLRDTTLFKWGSKLRGEGQEEDAIREVLLTLNQRCNPPFSPFYVMRKAHHIVTRYDAGTRQRSYADPAPETTAYPTPPQQQYYPTPPRERYYPTPPRERYYPTPPNGRKE